MACPHKPTAYRALIQKIAQIAFTLDEEEALTLTTVTKKLKETFDKEKLMKRFYDQFKKEHAEKSNMIDKQIEICLEQICEQGCRAVNKIIQQLEQGKEIEVVWHLSALQRGILLDELKSVMAVYAKTGSCDLSA